MHSCSVRNTQRCKLIWQNSIKMETKFRHCFFPHKINRRDFHSAWTLRQILVNLFLDSSRLESHKIHKREKQLSLACRRLGLQFDTGILELQRADGCKKNIQYRTEIFPSLWLKSSPHSSHIVYTNGADSRHFGRNTNIFLKIFSFCFFHWCLYICWRPLLYSGIPFPLWYWFLLTICLTSSII
jgi:hypothetical protein